MSIRFTLIFTLVAALMGAGCAAQRGNRAVANQDARSSPARATTNEVVVGPATQPIDAKANLTLDQIQPAPQLPTSRPALWDDRSPPPPLEALELYARARDALASGHQFTAISALERAIKLDPDSAELYRLVSRAYLAGGNTNKAVDALARAVQLEPDDLRSQTALARLHLQRGNAADAIDHLRIGLQSKQYADDEAAAGIADYFLAKSLQQQGYDRAALEQYEKLLGRLSQRTYALRSDAELSDWSARPQAIYSDVARLYEKRREYAKALDAWRQVAELDEDDLDVRQRVIEMLLALNRPDEALHDAATLVRQTGATSRSLEILRDVAKRVGREEAVYDELRRLQAERPGDRSLLFARVDLLTNNGRPADALRALEDAARVNFDHEIVRRLVRYYSERSQTTQAAKLLIEAAATKPDDTQTLLLLYASLLHPLRRDSLRAGDVQQIDVPPNAQAAKNYFVVIAANNRELLAREAIDRAIAAEPIFPPAFRLAMIRVWRRGDLDTAAKERVAQELIARAERSNLPALAHELRAYQLLARAQYAQAITEFENAFKIESPTPQPAMDCANAYSTQGNTAKYQQTLMRLINDRPMHQQAYAELIEHYLQPTGGNSAPAAVSVLQKWRAADPSSAMARGYEAFLRARAGASRDAIPMFVDVLKENPHDPDGINFACDALRALNQPLLVETLEQQLLKHPKNMFFAMQLLNTYERMNRTDDMQRVADRAREAAAGDARQLYLVATLYTRVDQKEKSRAALEESLRIDPDDPATNNDLGYTWAEDGINLDRAEAMARIAVQAEPDNGSFLDSLGWVYYKLGRFADARQQLETAVEVLPTGDPVLYDHLGDTLYRLNDSAGAQVQWNKALHQLVLTPARDDVTSLRTTLEQKIQQAQMGKTVNVAPVSEEPRPIAPIQAKN